MNVSEDSFRKKIIYPILKENGEIVKTLVKINTSNPGWQNKNLPIIVPISIHSAFHEGEQGEIKIKALFDYIHSYAKEKVMILMCEGAHLNVINIKNDDMKCTYEICRRDAHQLVKKFNRYFNRFDITFWNEFVVQHNHYGQYKSELLDLYNNDLNFNKLVSNDAENMYTEKLSNQYTNKKCFIDNTKKDILEMIVGCRIKFHEGYRIHIYPGKIFTSMEYIKNLHFKDMIFVNASLKVME